MDKSYNDIIDKTHFKTFNHVKSHFKDIDNKKLRKVIKNRIHDKYIKKDDIRPYFVKIFSSRPNTWFHDLYDNLKGNTPRYWHIFIGTNNRYVVVYPLENKSSKSIYKSLSTFINKYHPVKLTSDAEPGFLEKDNIKLCTDNNVSMHIIQDENHSSLSIIDRFLRTLRDMNTPTEKSKHQSHDIKYTFLTPKRMYKLINIYNNTYHSSIKCSPKKMFDNPELEKKYIFKCLEHQNKQQNIKNFILPINSFVRFIIPKNDKSKKRYQITRECYKIEDRKGNLYTLIAKDGTVITKTRYQLIPNNNNKVKWANTIPGKWNGSIDRILSFNSKTNKYNVLFKIPGKPPYKDTIPASYLRGSTPQKISEIEKTLEK